jgi:hypothetical protein
VSILPYYDKNLKDLFLPQRAQRPQRRGLAAKAREGTRRNTKIVGNWQEGNEEVEKLRG